MMFNYHDMYIGRSLDVYGEWTWEEIERTRHYAHGVVADVGANIGTHTLAYAKTAEKVIAIEPQYIVYQTLMANLALNCIENVLPLCCACGAKDGSVHMLDDLDYHQENNYGSLPIGNEGALIGMIRLDSLNLSPDFIKIDVEGYELEVLQGAQETIKRAWPVLYVENDRADRKAALIAFIESLGYSYEWHIPGLYNSDNFNGIKENIFPAVHSFNMLCLPKQ